LGKEVVDLCDGERNVGAITEVLALRYGKAANEIAPDVTAFLKSLRKVRMLDGEGSPPPSPDPVSIRSVFLHLTDRCNLRCIHCYVGGETQAKPELASERIHSLIDELAEMGGRSITLSGGEPLLRRDWQDIARHAGGALKVTINTNGTLITERTAECLAEVQPYIQVSLDGPDAETHDRIRGQGTFDAALRGIQALKDAGLEDNLIVSMTLMKQNICRAPKMIDFAASLGIPKIRFLPLHIQGRARSSRRELDASPDDYYSWFRHVYMEREQGPGPLEVFGGLIGFLLYSPGKTDEHWCSIGRSIVVDSEGDIHPCALLMDRRFVVGNVREMSLKEIESSPKLKGLTLACLARKDTIEKCRTCIWRNFCRASCPAFPFLEKGTFRETDDFCDFRRLLYEDAVFSIARGRSQT
jgi:radical SAM protein with 4Fe4S-binding SPASM domain